MTDTGDTPEQDQWHLMHEHESRPGTGSKSSDNAPLPARLVRAGFAVRETIAGSHPSITTLILGRDGDADRMFRAYSERSGDLDHDLYAKVLRFRDPNVQPILDADSSDGIFWELLPIPSGDSLAQFLSWNNHRLPRSLIPACLEQLMSGIENIHKALGIAHGNLRPEQIFIESLEPTFSLTITNPGLLMAVGTIPSGGPESSPYAPPESVLGSTGPAGDWWSLGLMMLEAISGAHPYRLHGRWLPITAEDRLRPLSVAAINDDRWRLLCRGLLVADPINRWTGSEISQWLQGDDPPVTAPEVQGASRPFEFAGHLCWTVEELIDALSENWSPAARMLASDLRQESLRAWLVESGVPSTSYQALTGNRSEASLDLKVAQLLHDLSGGRSRSFMGITITTDGLSRLAQIALGGSHPTSGLEISVAHARRILDQLIDSHGLRLFASSAATIDGPSLDLRLHAALAEMHAMIDQFIPTRIETRVLERLGEASAHLLLCEASDSYRQVIRSQAIDFAERFGSVEWYRAIARADGENPMTTDQALLLCLLGEIAKEEDKQGHLPPRIKFFTVTPDAAIVLTPLTLTWEVEGAQAVEIEDIGLVAAKGTMTVSARSSRSFSLSASNINGMSQMHSEYVTVLDAPKIVPTLPSSRLASPSITLTMDSELLAMSQLPTPFSQTPGLVPFENAEGFAESIPPIDIGPITVPTIPNIWDLVPDLQHLDERQKD